MNRAEILDQIKNKFKDTVKNLFEKSKKRVYIDIDRRDIADVARYVFLDLGARFNTASATDTPGGIEILYHFTFDRVNLIASIRVLLDKNHPHVDSITPVMEGAEWIEREMHELFGIAFDNHPNLKSLLLPDDWPKNKYPLKRDFKP